MEHKTQILKLPSGSDVTIIDLNLDFYTPMLFDFESVKNPGAKRRVILPVTALVTDDVGEHGLRAMLHFYERWHRENGFDEFLGEQEKCPHGICVRAQMPPEGAPFGTDKQTHIFIAFMAQKVGFDNLVLMAPARVL